MSDELVQIVDDLGILVHGPAGVVEAHIERLMAHAGVDHRSRSRLSSSDLGAVGLSGAAVAVTAGGYLRLAPESLARLDELGLTFNGVGVARDASGHIAAHLRFEHVALGAEQALALQSVAVSLALRSAIADVQSAIERVEDKVDRISSMLSSRLSGDVIGIYRELSRVVEATHRRGSLLPEDWDAVAPLRAKVSQDLEALRSFVISQAAGLSADDSVPRRAARLREFVEIPGHVVDVLSLILVAEKSLQFYEHLRIQRVRQRASVEVAAVVDEARGALRLQRSADSHLVEILREAVQRVRVIAPLEVHRVFSKSDLDTSGLIFDAKLREFAEASVLSAPDVLGEMPQATVIDAREEIRGRLQRGTEVAKVLGSSAARAAATRVSHRVSRGDSRRDTNDSTDEPGMSRDSVVDGNSDPHGQIGDDSDSGSALTPENHKL